MSRDIFSPSSPHLGSFATKATARKEVDRLGLREQANAVDTSTENVPVTFGRVVGLWLKKELSTHATTSQSGIRSYPTAARTAEVAEDSGLRNQTTRPARLASVA